MRGSGKTTLIAGQVNDMKKPVVIIDVFGNPKFENENWIHTNSIPNCLNEIANSFEFEDHPQIIVLQPLDYNTAIDEISRALWVVKGGTIVIDEGDSFDISEAPCFDEIIRYGRNRGVSLIVGCRRPAEISKHITAGANRIYCFMTHEPNDLKYFASVFGEHTELLASLPPFNGLFIDYDNGVMGKFSIDADGKIYHHNSWTIHKQQTPEPMTAQEGSLNEGV